MATRQHTVGEVVRIRPHGRGEYLWARTPSGIEVKTPSVGGASVYLWIAEAGEWQMRWENGEMETFEAVVAPMPEPEEVERTSPLSSPFRTSTP